MSTVAVDEWVEAYLNGKLTATGEIYVLLWFALAFLYRLICRWIFQYLNNPCKVLKQVCVALMCTVTNIDVAIVYIANIFSLMSFLHSGYCTYSGALPREVDTAETGLRFPDQGG